MRGFQHIVEHYLSLTVFQTLCDLNPVISDHEKRLIIWYDCMKDVFIYNIVDCLNFLILNMPKDILVFSCESQNIRKVMYSYSRYVVFP